MLGIWDIAKGDWIRSPNGIAILAFEKKMAACQYAARCWGFSTYTQAKLAGWCEVKPLTKVKR